MANRGPAEANKLSCSICSRLLREPKTLPCMHRFCEACLRGHIIASTARGNLSKPGFPCPVCREFIPPPCGSSTPSTWAGLFRTDLLIKSVVEVHQLQQQVSVPRVSNPCPKHADKEQELYCFDCSVPVCHLCAVISHRRCSKIGTVKEAAQKRRATWQGYTEQLSALIFQGGEIQQKREINMRNVNRMKTDIEIKIRQTAEKVRQNVRDEERRLLNCVHNNFETLNQYDLTFTRHINNLENLEADVVTTLASSSDFDLVTGTGILETLDSCRIESVVTNGDLRQLCQQLPSVKWSFQPNNVPCLNLGNIQFTCDAPVIDGLNFPIPSFSQPSTSAAFNREPQSGEMVDLYIELS